MSNLESTQTGFDNVGQQIGSDQSPVRPMVDMANPSEVQSLMRPLDSQSQSGVTSNGQLVFDNPYSSGGSNGGPAPWTDGNAGAQGQWSDLGSGGQGNGGGGWPNGGGWDLANGQSGSGTGTANNGGESGILATETNILNGETNILNGEVTMAGTLTQDIAALTPGTATTDAPTTSTSTTTVDAPTTSTATTTTDTPTTPGDSTTTSNQAGSSPSNPSPSQVLGSLEQSDPSLNQVITDATNGNATTAALSSQGLSDLENAIVTNNPTANPNLDAAAAGQTITAVQNDTSNPNAATDAANLQAILQTDMPAAVMMANLQQNDPTLDQTLTTAATQLSQQGNTDLQNYVLNNYGTTSDSQLMSNAVTAVQGDASNPNAASDATALQAVVSESNLSTTAPGGDSNSTAAAPTDSSSSSSSTSASGEQQILQQIETTLTSIEQELTTLIGEVSQLEGGSSSSGDSTTTSNPAGSSATSGSSSSVLASLEQSDPSLNQVITDATNGNSNTPALSSQGLSDLENAIVANNPTGNPNLDAAALGAAVAAVQGDTNNPNAATDASNLQAILQSDDPTAAMMANLDQNDPTLAQTMTTAATELSSQGNSDLQQYVLNNYGTTSDSQLISNAVTAVQGDSSNPSASSDASALQALAADSNLSTIAPGGDNSSNPNTSSDGSTSSQSTSQVLANLEQADPNLNQVITDATNGNSNTSALSSQGLSDLENAIVANNPTGNPNLDAAALGAAVAAVQGDTSNPNAATDASSLQAILQADYPAAGLMANLDQNDPTLAQTLTTAASDLSQQGNTDLQNYVLNNYGTTSDSQLMSNAVTAVQGDASNPNAASDVSALQTLLSQTTLSTTAPGGDSTSTATTSNDGTATSSSDGTSSSIQQQFQAQFAQIEQQIASLLAELQTSPAS